MKTEYLVMFKVKGKWIRTEKLRDMDEAVSVERVFHDAGIVARILQTSEEICLH